MAAVEGIYDATYQVKARDMPYATLAASLQL